MGCTCAVKAEKKDDFQLWKCGYNGVACILAFPDSIECAEKYGRGPDTVNNQEE